jgi:hypothetical protein
MADFDYLVFCSKDYTVLGDAFIALSTMSGLGSRDRAFTYLEARISAMKSDTYKVSRSPCSFTTTLAGSNGPC